MNNQKLSFSVKNILKNIPYKDYGLMLSFVSVFVGLLGGVAAFVMMDEGLKAEITKSFSAYIVQLTSSSKCEIFLSFILSGIIYFFVIFYSGGSIFARETVIIITALKFAGLSMLLACLYSTFNIEGFEYAILVLMPGKFLFIFGSLLLTKDAFDFSGKLRKNIFEKAEHTTLLKRYMVRSLTVLLIFSVSWIIDFTAYLLFSPLFEFFEKTI